MELVLPILLSGITVGAMYALAAVGLSLIYGTLGMLNMAHGVFMTIGAYASYSVATQLGASLLLGVAVAMGAGILVAVVTHFAITRFILSSDNFEMNIIVATAGLAILLEDLLLKTYGGYPYAQPVEVAGQFQLAGIVVTYQSVAILAVAAILIAAVAILLLKTRFGRAIRATAMNHDAARLMGVRTEFIYLQVMGIAGALAGVAGLMISNLVTLSPQMGAAPFLKAFVICVVAGMGNVVGAGICAFALAILEAAVGFYFGVRFGFPVMLGIVIATLIWRPSGLFGKEKVVRL